MGGPDPEDVDSSGVVPPSAVPEYVRTIRREVTDRDALLAGETEIAAIRKRLIQEGCPLLSVRLTGPSGNLLPQAIVLSAYARSAEGR